MRARTAVAAAASAGLVAAGVVAGASAATAADRPARQDAFAAARAATARYLDIEVAQAAGFGELKDAAGIAWIDNAAAGWAFTTSTAPGSTRCSTRGCPRCSSTSRRRDGSMQLGALEYVIFASAGPASGANQDGQ